VPEKKIDELQHQSAGGLGSDVGRSVVEADPKSPRRKFEIFT